MYVAVNTTTSTIIITTAIISQHGIAMLKGLYFTAVVFFCLFFDV